MTSADVAARIKELRLVMGNRSQKAAADAIGVSEATWQRMEAGDGLPKGETLLGLAGLGFSPTWLLTGKGLMRLDDPAVPSPAPAPAAPSRLYGVVKTDWLEDAFRTALDQGGLDPDQLGDTFAIMALTLLLYDARAQKAQAEKTKASTEAERVDIHEKARD